MSRQQAKEKENRITQFILLGMFGFTLVLTLLDSISIQPNIFSLTFYLLLIVVVASLYKPFRNFLLRFFSYLLNTIKSFFVKDSIVEINEIDQMNEVEFEKYLKRLFERHGYVVKIRKAELGANLLVRKGTNKYVVLTKCCQKNIGKVDIQQVIPTIKQLNVTGALVVTNQYYTKSAVRLAESKLVVIIDRDQLIKMNSIPNNKHHFSSAISFLLNK